MKKEIPKFIDPEFLIDNCYLQTIEDVRHNFTSDEVINLKDSLFEISIKTSIRNDLLKKIKKLLNESIPENEAITTFKTISIQNIGNVGLKQLKIDFAKTLSLINAGYEIRQQILYGFDHQELKVMAMYDESGNYVYDRPLSQSERQTKIKSLLKSN